MELKRPGIVTLFAATQFAGAVFWLLLSVIAVAVVTTQQWPLVSLVPVVVLCAVAILLQVSCGAGLWYLRPWGRILQMALAGVGLLLFPIGTFVAVLMLAYLAQPGVKLMFSGKPASELTAEETAQIDAVVQPSKVRRMIAIAAVAIVALAWIAVAAVIVPKALSRAKMVANEQRAIDALASLAAAQREYATECGRGGYAGSFDVLNTALPDATIPTTKGIAGPLRGVSGYWISLRQAAGTATGPSDCHGVPTVTGWYATATPETFQYTGMRSFAMNDAGVMWESTTAEPPTEPFGPPATPVPSLQSK